MFRSEPNNTISYSLLCRSLNPCCSGCSVRSICKGVIDYNLTVLILVVVDVPFGDFQNCSYQETNSGLNPCCSGCSVRRVANYDEGANYK